MNVLTDTEINEILQIEADKLTYEEAVELTTKIISLPGTEGGSTIDKILYTVRNAYLTGFRQALETYNQAIIEQKRSEES